MSKSKPTAPKSIGRQLNFAAGVGSSVATHLLAPHDLSLAQWAVLNSLWQNGPLSLKELAELTGNAPPATSRIVDRMIASGLVARTQDKTDRRGVTIALTNKSEAMRPLAAIFEEVNKALLHTLSEAEQEALFGLLKKVESAGRRWLADRA